MVAFNPSAQETEAGPLSVRPICLSLARTTWWDPVSKNKTLNKQISHSKGLFYEYICVIEYYAVTKSHAVKLIFIKMEYSQYMNWKERIIT